MEEPDDPSEDVCSWPNRRPSSDLSGRLGRVVCFVSFDELDFLAAARLSVL